MKALQKKRLNMHIKTNALTTMRAPMNAFQKRLNMHIKTNALTTTTAPMNAFQKGLNMHIKPMLTFQ